MAGAFQIMKGVAHRGPREGKGLAKIFKIEFKLAHLPLVIRDLIKDMKFLIDVGNVFESRERYGLKLMKTSDVIFTPN